MFRTGTNLVRVDVVVRDRNGNVVTGLKAADFLVTEDGKAQQVTSFDFEEIATDALPGDAPAPARARPRAAAERRAAQRDVDRRRDARPGAAAAPPAPSRRAGGSAGPPARSCCSSTRARCSRRRSTAPSSPPNKYVDKQMTPADLVAVASVGQSLTILRDFTADRDAAQGDAGGVRRDGRHGLRAARRGRRDRRRPTRRPIRPTCRSTTPSSASSTTIAGCARCACSARRWRRSSRRRRFCTSAPACRGAAATTRSSCAPSPTRQQGQHVDLSGRQPRPDGRRARRRGGRRRTRRRRRPRRRLVGVLRPIDAEPVQLAQRVAGDADDARGRHGRRRRFSTPTTSGRRSRACSATCRPTTCSATARTNTAQGRQVPQDQRASSKNTQPGYSVEARNGYYAAADFAHLKKDDRERQLQEQIASAVSSTDLPVVASTSWFRVAERSLLRAGVGRGARVGRPRADARRRSGSASNASVDLLGVVTDEQGRSVGRIRDTMQIPAAQAADARDQAAAVSVRRHAAGRSLQGEGRRARERGRHDGHVRVSDHDSRPEGRAAQGQPDRAQHAAAHHARRRAGSRGGGLAGLAAAAAAGRGGGRPRRWPPAASAAAASPASAAAAARMFGNNSVESAAARRPGDRAEPDARRDAGPADVLLLRGLRPDARTPAGAAASSRRASRSIAAA